MKNFEFSGVEKR